MKADKSASEESHASLADDISPSKVTVNSLTSARPPSPAKFLTKLTVKSWKLLNLSVSFSLDRTTIVGPVGSGKSSVLDAIFACFASNEIGKWDQSMGVGPKKDDHVSILTEGMLRGKRWEIELDSEGSGGGTKGISNFRLTKSLKQSIRVLYVPQDYGTRSPGRYDRFSWCLTWKKFLNGDFNRYMDDLDFKKRLARICGLEFKDDKFYNVAADSEIPFIHLSGGQIDAILCLLAITLSAKMSDECLVLFDEPGQNLGAHERELLRRQIFSCNAQVIIITHHVEMLDRTSLPYGVIRFLRPSGTLHRKRSELTANMADLGKEIAENLDKEEAQIFIKFLRSPENLSLLFASSLLLVEGFSDVRTLLALDEIWKKSAWIGLNCSIVNCNGKSSVFLVWRCLQVLFESLQLPAFALLDLDALFKDALKLSDNDDGVQGGHVYYTLGAKPKLEHLGWLLNSVIEEDNRVSGRKDNLLQPTTVEAVLDVIKTLEKKWTCCKWLAKFVNEVKAGDKLAFRSPDVLNVFVKSLNWMLLANISFPAFIWPAHVADIEGVVFDKSWEYDFFLPRWTLRNQGEPTFEYYQTRLMSDGFLFLQASRLFPDSDARRHFLMQKFGVPAGDSKLVSFTERNKGAKLWLQNLAAADFDAFKEIFEKPTHPLCLKYCATGYSTIKKDGHRLVDAVIRAFVDEVEKVMEKVSKAPDERRKKAIAANKLFLECASLQFDAFLRIPEFEYEIGVKADVGKFLGEFKLDAKKRDEEPSNSLLDQLQKACLNQDWAQVEKIVQQKALKVSLREKMSDKEDKHASILQEAEKFFLEEEQKNSSTVWQTAFFNDGNVHPMCVVLNRLADF